MKIDELFSRKLKDLESTPQENSWDKVKAGLQQNPRKGVFFSSFSAGWTLGIAASLLLLLLAGVVLWNRGEMNNMQALDDQQETAKQEEIESKQKEVEPLPQESASRQERPLAKDDSNQERKAKESVSLAQVNPAVSKKTSRKVQEEAKEQNEAANQNLEQEINIRLQAWEGVQAQSLAWNETQLSKPLLESGMLKKEENRDYLIVRYKPSNAKEASESEAEKEDKNLKNTFQVLMAAANELKLSNLRDAKDQLLSLNRNNSKE